MKQRSTGLATHRYAALIASAAEAWGTTSQTFGPDGYSASRTVHRDDMTVTRSGSRGTFGLPGCEAITRVRRQDLRALGPPPSSKGPATGRAGHDGTSTVRGAGS